MNRLAGFAFLFAISTACYAEDPPGRAPASGASGSAPVAGAATTPAGSSAAAAPSERPKPSTLSTDELLKVALDELLKMQEDDGAWPYEGVYRVRGDIPLGYRVAGTAIVCEVLIFALPPGDARAEAALDRGIEYILSKLDDPLLAPSTKDTYDVRVWGHSHALELFLHLRAQHRAGKFADRISPWIPRLVDTLVTEELEQGGWNYASRRAPASFVTAPVTQTLLLARGQGEKVPDEVLIRARDVLANQRTPGGAFLYSGQMPKTATRPARMGPGADSLPGSIARCAVAETTLQLLGEGSTERIQRALDAFQTHWEELEKRRRKTGTHEGPYGIAPYYFYYGHRYAAQAIHLLPESDRERERKRLLELILRTRDDDGTWNDRVFSRSRNYGTAMIAMALLGDRAPLPPAYVPPKGTAPGADAAKSSSSP